MSIISVLSLNIKATDETDEISRIKCYKMEKRFPTKCLEIKYYFDIYLKFSSGSSEFSLLHIGSLF